MKHRPRCLVLVAVPEPCARSDDVMAQRTRSGVSRRRGRRVGALVAATVLLLTLGPPAADAQLPAPATVDDIHRVSTSSSGIAANGASTRPSISAHGTVVAFESRATNLVPEDSDQYRDIYVKDLRTGQITLASIDPSGTKWSDDASYPSLSSDGSKVAFEVGGGIVLKDLGDASLTLVTSSGTKPSLSDDGSVVAFETSESLDPADAYPFGRQVDVYVKNMVTSTLSWVSFPNHSGANCAPSVSGDGTKVAFVRKDPLKHECGPGAGINRYSSVLIRDLTTGELVVGAHGGVGPGLNDEPSLSRYGVTLAFSSITGCAESGDPAEAGYLQWDVFVKTLQTGRCTTASWGPEFSGLGSANYVEPSLAADGSKVAFAGRGRVFTKDLLTGEVFLASSSATLPAGGGQNPSLSADGKDVAFSSGSGFDPEDTDIIDIYVKNLEPRVIRVAIDIKPGDSKNAINLASRGKVPVAILTTPILDAVAINLTSVCFGDAETREERQCRTAREAAKVEDADGDGDQDVILHFDTPQTGIDPDDTSACLQAQSEAGVELEGCDAVSIVGKTR